MAVEQEDQERAKERDRPRGLSKPGAGFALLMSMVLAPVGLWLSIRALRSVHSRSGQWWLGVLAFVLSFSLCLISVAALAVWATGSEEQAAGPADFIPTEAQVAESVVANGNFLGPPPAGSADPTSATCEQSVGEAWRCVVSFPTDESFNYRVGVDRQPEGWAAVPLR